MSTKAVCLRRAGAAGARSGGARPDTGTSTASGTSTAPGTAGGSTPAGHRGPQQAKPDQDQQAAGAHPRPDASEPDEPAVLEAEVSSAVGFISTRVK